MTSERKHGISCIIAAYNEAERIGGVLDAVSGHPLLNEAIVVDDGSRDGTDEVVRRYQDITLLAHAPNRGKTHAFVRGFLASRYDHILMLDADLVGLTKDNITALVEPILRHEADMTVSLRKNSLGIYRLVGMDFVSGERCYPAHLLTDISALDTLPGFGLESHLNTLAIAKKLRIKSVKWDNVIAPRKSAKMGFWAGAWGDVKMVSQIISLLGFFGMLRQYAAMLRLKK